METIEFSKEIIIESFSQMMLLEKAFMEHKKFVIKEYKMKKEGNVFHIQIKLELEYF